MDKKRIERAGEGLLVATVTVEKPSLTMGDTYFSRTCARGPARQSMWFNRPNVGVVEAYDGLYRAHRTTEAVIAYMHNDVEVFDEGWADGVLVLFRSDPKVAIVGLGGATGMGVPDIYKIPYEITQLQRIEYYSNQRGWEIHGKREVGVRDVAVVDGFFMAVRTQFLDQVGGWKWIESRFHCYDTAMSLAALRHGWKVQMIGIDCDHHGGGTSTKAEYVQHCREFGTTPEREHSEPHAWQYREFADVLPVRVGQ